MKVLIVDNDVENKKLYHRREFEGIYYEVLTDELETLRTLTDPKCPFDAVLLDLAMPVLDGFELATQIQLNKVSHQIRVELRVAFYSAWDVDNDILRMMQSAGVERFFRKPIDPISLSKEICKWLRP